MFVGTTTGGNVHIFNPGSTTPSATIDLPGAIYGLQLDAAFPQNGYVYVIHTANGGNTQRLSRYTVGPDNKLVGSETILVGAGASCQVPAVEEDCIFGGGSHDAGTIRTDA